MTKEQVGSIIKTRRIQLKLTQKQVAEKLGLQVQHMPNIEKGITNLTLDSLFKICDALQLEINFKTVKPPKQL